MKVTQGQYSFR